MLPRFSSALRFSTFPNFSIPASHSQHRRRPYTPKPTYTFDQSIPLHESTHTYLKMSTQQYGNYGGANASEAQQQVDINARTVHYKCGDCDQDVPLKRGEPIRCRQCGHRVLYKQRTNR